MSYFSIELICHGEKESIYLPLFAHTHKYIERFLYTDRIDSSSAPLVYFESEEMDSWRDLQIVDCSWSISQNDVRYTGGRDNWIVTEGKNYSSVYSSIAATNKIVIDDRGEIRPLFYRHSLPVNTIEATLQIIGLNEKEPDTAFGYVIDLASGSVYTNYKNFFDPVTGAYRLYYIISTDSDGNSTTALLNPVPMAKFASWEDVNPDGTLTTDYPVYSVEKNSSGYTYHFNTVGPWYIKSVNQSVIKPLLPTGRNSEDSWFVRFSAGDFTALVNSRVRRYWLPEFEVQNYFPSKPYIFSPYRHVSWVNSRTIHANRDKISVNPNKYMHFTLFVYDVDETLIRVLTTDSAKNGKRYSDTSVFIESDKILSWDNSNGFVSFGLDLDSANSYYAEMFYEADDLEYSLKSLNPLHNSMAFDYMWVYYVIPDVDEKDRAIHLLGIAKDGTVAYCSQGQGYSHPNLQLFNSDGTPNSNTIIGMKYISADPLADTFTRLHTSGYSNDYAYFVIAEVICMDRSLESNCFICDSRREVGISTTCIDAAIQANPRILQSDLCTGEDGLQVPESGAIIIRPPLSLLEEYGGELTQQQAEDYLTTYVPAATSVVFIWEGPRCVLDGTSETGHNALTFSWEGPSLTYNIYKRGNPSAEWALLYSIVNPGEALLSYNDTNVVSKDIYYYCVVIEKDGIEYASSNILSLQAR